MTIEIIRHGKDAESGECSTIRRIIKGIDERFDVYFDHDKERYVITQHAPGGLVATYASFVWPTREFFDNMRRDIYISRNGNLLREIVQHNADLEDYHAKKTEENIDLVTREAAPAMLRAFKDV
jgi:hypothetical protein